jgi:cysteine-rich repeat protein
VTHKYLPHRLFRISFVSGVTVMLVACLAWEASALDGYEIRCRDAMANVARHAASRVMKFRTRCVHLKLTDSISGVDCGAPAGATGDLQIDRRLTKFERSRDRAARALTRKCDNPNVALDVDPIDVLQPGTACDGLADWSDVGPCLVDLGKEIGEELFQLIDITPPSPPVSQAATRCFVETAEQARHALFTLNLWRARCYAEDDKLVDGGGFFDCDGISAWPGQQPGTGWDRADERLEFPLRQLYNDLNGWISDTVFIDPACDLNLPALGFPAVIPEHSRGRYTGLITPDDMFDALADAVIDGSTRMMAELFPVEEFCGDGSAGGPAEQCDDDGDVRLEAGDDIASDDGCDRDCSDPVCGNGAIDGTTGGLPEECDDGNTSETDGCNNSCRVTRCGDGVVNPGWYEVCDDGDNLSNDHCPSDFNGNCFALAVCGDGFVCTQPDCATIAPGFIEQCDDGNDINTDGCLSSNTSAATRCRTASCGDGVLRAGVEQCDDGNNNNGDGCSAGCMIEP